MPCTNGDSNICRAPTQPHTPSEPPNTSCNMWHTWSTMQLMVHAHAWCMHMQCAGDQARRPLPYIEGDRFWGCGAYGLKLTKTENRGDKKSKQSMHTADMQRESLTRVTRAITTHSVLHAHLARSCHICIAPACAVLLLRRQGLRLTH